MPTQQVTAPQNVILPANANMAPIMTNNGMTSAAVQYQWMTVQAGVHNLGQPVYRQQLVPVTTPQQLSSNVVPVTAPSAQFQSFGQNNVSVQQQTEDLSQYRVVGKPLTEPLQQVLQEKKPDPELAGVSSELKKAFARAVAETEHSTSNEVTISSKDSARAVPIELLPSDLQSSLPPLRYQAHIYSTEVSKRWIKLNNRELYEGDSIGALRVVEITPEQTLFDFDGYEFSMKAMQDWLP
jgi:general secretion pathway protein B